MNTPQQLGFGQLLAESDRFESILSPLRDAQQALKADRT
jgi:hypothetical protein